ncbi:MAG: T9SS type A sorting domain-containing protein, partial [bacterium]|nr:T9SS type A sorting domain-containing protein [bacterium]
GTVHRQKMSDGVKDSSRDRRPCLSDDNVRDMVPESRTTVGKSFTNSTDKSVCRTDSGRTPSPESRTPTNGTPIAQSPLPIAELLLPTSLGELRTALPSVYQISANGTRNEIDAVFELTDKNTFGITLPNGYNPDHSLRIDPLVYSTFLGGGNTDIAQDVLVDRSGMIYCGGETTSTDYPLTPGAVQPFYLGMYDCVVTKFNSACTQLLFSTYLGGSSMDALLAMALANDDGIYFTGSSMSPNFPTTRNAYDRTFNGGEGDGDAIIVHLNSSGNELLASSFFGGTDNENSGFILRSPSNYIYIGGYTKSPDLPVTAGAFDTSFTPITNCYLAKFDASISSLLACTFIGDSGGQLLFHAELSRDGSILAAGTTTCAAFPTTPGAYQTEYRGTTNQVIGGDGFLLKIDSSLSQLTFSTLLGDSAIEMIYAFKVLNNDDIVCTGYTNSLHFPITTDAIQDTFQGGGCDGFVVKFNATGTRLLYSTYLGGNNSDNLWGICIDSTNKIAICGRTQSSNYPTTANAIQPTSGGGFDGILTYLDSSCSQLVNSTYLGGFSTDNCSRIRQIGDDEFLVVGFTGSPDFPITSTGYDTAQNGDWDVFLLKIILDPVSVATEVSSHPNDFYLYPNYPNPFNATTRITYSTQFPSRVRLVVYDVTGRNVATLADTFQSPGKHSQVFSPHTLPSGVYFVQLQVGKEAVSRKLVLLK